MIEFKTGSVDAKSVIYLGGQIDSTAAVEFEEKMLQVLATEHAALIIDFTQVKFISSAGLRVLLLAAKKVKAVQGKLSLCHLAPDVHEVFEISGFSALFTIYPSLEDAVKG